MWKGIAAVAVAAIVVGTSVVFAQDRFGYRDQGERWRPSMEDLRAFGEARLAALKAGLTLTTDQEKNWPAFEQAARELGKLRLERWSAMRSAPPSADPVERMQRRAAAMSETGAALKRLADATGPLYQSLDESQKRRFAMLSRFSGRQMGGGHHHYFRGDHDDGGSRHHYGPRRMDGGYDAFDPSDERNL